MSNRLGGKQGTAYTGTNANQPPNMNFNNRPPNNYDIQYSIGDFWVDSSAPDIEKLWVLVSLDGTSTSKGQLAHWIQVGTGSGTGLQTLTADSGGAIPGDGANNINITAGTGIVTAGDFASNTITISTTGAFAEVFDADVGSAAPILDTMIFAGGSNINTSAAGNTVTTNLNDFIVWPASGISSGYIDIGGEVAFHTFDPINTPSTNLFAGEAAGNFSMTTSVSDVGLGQFSLGLLTTGSENTTVGYSAGKFLDTGDNNVAVGSESLLTADSASDNVAIGYQSLENIVSGTHNTCIGSGSGSNYEGSESSNIVIGSNGGVIGDNSTIRIGTGSQTSAYVAGIYGTTGLTSTRNVVVKSDGQLGTDNGSGGSGNAFFAYLSADSRMEVGANLLGAATVYTILFDNSGGLYPGDGAGSPMVWTAPSTGIFVFNSYVFPTFPYRLSFGYASLFQISIIPSSGIVFSAQTSESVTNDFSPVAIYNALLQLTSGDTVTFGCYNPTGVGQNIFGGTNVYPPSVSTGYATWVSGWQIS